MIDGRFPLDIKLDDVYTFSSEAAGADGSLDSA